MNARHETINAKHEAKQKSQWLMLPDEIYSHVIAFLPQTLSFGLVCKQFYTYMRRYTVIDREKLMLLFRRYSCNAKKILDDNISKIYFHYEGKYDYFIELLPDENVEYLYMNPNIIFGDDKYYYTFAKLAAKNNNVSLFKKIVQNIDINVRTTKNVILFLIEFKHLICQYNSNSSLSSLDISVLTYL